MPGRNNGLPNCAKLVEGSNDFRRMGVMDASGVLDMELVRKSLPRGFFFRHVFCYRYYGEQNQQERLPQV